MQSMTANPLMQLVVAEGQTKPDEGTDTHTHTDRRILPSIPSSLFDIDHTLLTSLVNAALPSIALYRPASPPSYPPSPSPLYLLTFPLSLPLCLTLFFPLIVTPFICFSLCLPLSYTLPGALGFPSKPSRLSSVGPVYMPL